MQVLGHPGHSRDHGERAEQQHQEHDQRVVSAPPGDLPRLADDGRPADARSLPALLPPRKAAAPQQRCDGAARGVVPLGQPRDDPAVVSAGLDPRQDGGELPCRTSGGQ
jgi:hypothetical protein